MTIHILASFPVPFQTISIPLLASLVAGFGVDPHYSDSFFRPVHCVYFSALYSAVLLHRYSAALLQYSGATVLHCYTATLQCYIVWVPHTNGGVNGLW